MAHSAVSRRAFIQRFTVGVVGALALAHVPAAVVKAVGLTEPARRYACEYLRKVYYDAMRGNPASQCPRRMEAGRELFEAYEGELIACERFTSTADSYSGPPELLFKGARLQCVGRGWTARVVA